MRPAHAVAVLALALLLCASLLTGTEAFLRLRSQEEVDARRASTAATRAAARVRYQSPSSGNSEFNNSAVSTTMAEIDYNDFDWVDDRPHSELFFLPSECPTANRSCCQSYEGEVCGGTSRGSCVNVLADDSVCKQSDGFYWFTDYFDYACVCSGNYWGPACGECKLGWMGDDCNTLAPLLVRRDFAKLSTVDKQYVIDAFRLSKLTPSPYQPNVSVFDFWATVHHWSLPGGAVVDILKRPALADISEGHVGSGAIPYHRALVAGLEHGLQYATGNFTFALPYWNWTYSSGNDNDETLLWFGGDGDTEDMGKGIESFCRQPPPNSAWMGECDCRMNRGPFALWPLIGDWAYPLNDTIERAFGCHSLWAPSLPFQPAVDCAITDSQFDMPDHLIVVGSDEEATSSSTTTTTTTTSKHHRSSSSHMHTSRMRRGQRLDVKVGYDVTEADLELWETGAVFHNLLGGGFLCGNYWTWPMAMKETDLHERTHRWLSGTLLGHHPASDPLFWMLHGYADTIYEQWLRNTNALGRLGTADSWSADHGPLGHTRYECQGPLYPLRKQWSCFNDSRTMGFTYDIFEDDAETPAVRPTYFGSRWQQEYPIASNLTEVFSLGAEGATALAATALDAGESKPDSVLLFTPSACSTESRDCCPEYLGSVCGGVSRGSCLGVFDAKVCSSAHTTSMWWFTKNFDNVCVCEGNYDGADCGSCKAGWEGDDCNTESTVRVRRDFESLSHDERQTVVDAFNLARVAASAYHPAVTVFEHFASTVFWLQEGNSAPSVNESAWYTHNMEGSVLWQRGLLLRFEAELQRITGNSTFTIPYWNYAASMGNDNDAVLRHFGGDGATNSSSQSLTNIYCRIADRSGLGGCNCSVSRSPFYALPAVGNFGESYGTVQRSFGCLGSVAASLPSKSVVDYVVTIDTFYDEVEENFAKTMTGHIYEDGLHTWPSGKHGDMQARVQNWIGGTSTTAGLASMRSLASSPGSDPMYYMMLGYSDLLLERWQRRAIALNDWDASSALPLTGNAAGMNRLECLPALFPLTTNSDLLALSTSFGYSYDWFESNSVDE